MAGFLVYEIPLSATPQKINVRLGNINYILSVVWRQNNYDLDQAGWFLDIADSSGDPIKNGIPFVTGADLIEQYAYLGIGGGGKLIVQSDSNPQQVPTYANLGQTSHLYWYPNP